MFGLWKKGVFKCGRQVPAVPDAKVQNVWNQVCALSLEEGRALPCMPIKREREERKEVRRSSPVVNAPEARLNAKKKVKPKRKPKPMKGVGYSHYGTEVFLMANIGRKRADVAYALRIARWLREYADWVDSMEVFR